MLRLHAYCTTPTPRGAAVIVRRGLCFALCCMLLSASVVQPASALSTGQEVELGKQTDKQVTDATNVVTDPLLNAWVNGITTKLWAQVARKDVPYNIKIMDVADVNAFSTLGGYVYVNLGTLDFVQSDDELAGVLGHETGHIERRHAVTTQNKAGLINILLSVGSIFSPLLAPFGQFLGAGAIAKIERTDETEADRYGLMLMSRAGYDPDAMVSFMSHLGALETQNHESIDTYLADHPGVPNRIAHLVGYPQLDPTKRTADQREAAALHNIDEARYAVAARDFAALLRKNATDTVAMYHLGEAQIALGQTAKGEQNLAQAAATGTAGTRTLALGLIHGLRDTEKRLDVMHPNLPPLRAAVAQAQAANVSSAARVSARREATRDALKALTGRLTDIQNEMPDLARISPQRGGRLEAMVRSITTIGRSLNGAIGKLQNTVAGVGSLEHNKAGGVFRGNDDIYNDLAAPLRLDSPPPQASATFAFYPRIIDGLTRSDADLGRAVDGASASTALLETALGDLDEFVRELAHVPYDSGDIPPADAQRIAPALRTATASIDRAATAAAQANQSFMLARARQLVADIDMLGVASSADRYATLKRALDVRFGSTAPSYEAMLHDDLSPGDVAAAVIAGADLNVTPAVIEHEAASGHTSIVDSASARGMNGEALEIMLGLVYLDYTDDPDAEAHGRG